ncbi:MAG: chemotaxis response regulator protein-glutamate methylesterase [Myxococcales bacterium]|nr:chemotaxis response regulator protein-glutamate methylesterase [Myxococcales bacterium]
MASAIRVLIVDDSPLICEMLTGIFSSDSTFEVVGIAHDPYEARDLIKRLKPDVITLDIEMPKMDGITFLKNLMRLRPMPVVMISSLTQRGSRQTLEALEVGAFDFVGKPRAGGPEGDVTLVQDEIRRKVRAAARSQIAKANQPRAVAVAAPTSIGSDNACVIGIGASTGGTQALKQVLAEMPSDSPPILVVQHLPASFSVAFVERLNSICPMKVCLGEDGMRLERGHVYVAPGDFQMTVSGHGRIHKLTVRASGLINGHMPAVDPLFNSMATSIGARCIAALLTGMGADGADGLLALRSAGAHTIAQDKASSVVWGMPGEAVKRDAACEVVDLGKVAARLVGAVRGL